MGESTGTGGDAGETTASSTVVRDHLRDALYADLVGPYGGAVAHGSSDELIRQRPSTRYLTGFLVPDETREVEADEEEGSMGAGDDVVVEDGAPEEEEPKQRKLFPASMGMSFLLPASVEEIEARVSFATYGVEREDRKQYWRRRPFPEVTLSVPLDAATLKKGIPVTGMPSVALEGVIGTVESDLSVEVPAGTKAVSLFVVNRRAVPDRRLRDEETLFQVQLSVHSPEALVPRPNRKGERSTKDMDARIAELQYRKNAEYGVGHNVSAEPIRKGDEVFSLRSRWIPEVEIRLVDA
ncbi:MAG: hypothetical protein KC416_01040, partial [Myxococcales bacterium]|nr:hypothetical protein [Myxococcales bacterium]